MLKKLSFHIIFWLISLNICAFIFGYQNNWDGAYLLTAIYAPIPICSAYFIERVLVKKYLLQRRVLKFIVYLIYLVIVSMLLLMILNTIILITFAKLEYAMLPNATKDIVGLFSNLYLLVFLFVGTQSTKKYSEIQKEQESTLKKIAQTELKLLRSQLNPHFLFNTLNNLYSLALQKSDQTPEAILKLSRLLDRVLHSNNSELIPLKEELDVVNDYIYLESLRYGKRLDISRNIQIKDLSGIMVPPLSILLLIENCFKHGAQISSKKFKIDLSADIINELLIVSTKNHFQSNKNSSHGIGLENLRQQIKHIYKDKASLQTSQVEELFLAELKLPL